MSEQLSKAVASIQANSPIDFSTNVEIQDFKAALEEVVEDAQDKSPILIAGDFNAWCTDWGSKKNNPRGLILADTLARLNVCLLIHGTQSTYSMAGRESIIDLTFASPELARDAAWQVSDVYTHSDHKAIITELLSRIATRRTQPARHVGYKVNTLDREALFSSVQTINATGDANGCAQGIADCIKAACKASMAKLYNGGSRHKPVPWSKRKILRNLIIESKSRCFQELGDAADAEPFGAAYRMVMGKLDKQPMPTCATTLESTVRHFFPQQPPLNVVVYLPNTAEAIVLTTASEVLEIAGKSMPGKAPSPDGIPNAVLKAIIAAQPDGFVNMYNKCLTDHTIPLRWKKQKLVLIPKPGKKLEDPSSYRRLCMLDTTVKIMEKIICNRLESEIENRCGLSDHRKHRSTTDAIGELVDIASRAMEVHQHQSIPRHQCHKQDIGKHQRPKAAKQESNSRSSYLNPAVWIYNLGSSHECAIVQPGLQGSVQAMRTKSHLCILHCLRSSSTVIAGMIPLDLLAAEQCSGITGSRSQRENTILQWQARWQSSANGSWTRRLIRDIQLWIKRRHGQVDFYICQLLTGHGCFRAYLHRFKHTESPYCDHCRGEVVDDAEHAFSECPLFESLRRRM
ncbi:hypothetical protein ACLKA6_001113 [Drosophila palustris]